MDSLDRRSDFDTNDKEVRGGSPHKLVNGGDSVLRAIMDRCQVTAVELAPRAHGRTSESGEILPEVGDALRWNLHMDNVETALTLGALLEPHERAKFEQVAVDYATNSMESGHVKLGLGILAALKREPFPAKVLRGGRMAFARGDLEQGLLAYRTLGKTPSMKELLHCAEKASARGEFDVTSACYLLAIGMDAFGSDDSAQGW